MRKTSVLYTTYTEHLTKKVNLPTHEFLLHENVLYSDNTHHPFQDNENFSFSMWDGISVL